MEKRDPSTDTTQLDPPDPAQRFGAAAAADAEIADRVADASDDEAEAEREFAERSEGPVRTEKAPPEDG